MSEPTEAWSLKEETARREDGGRSGFWRITDDGCDFLAGRLAVPKYARVYNGQVLGFTGDPVKVHDVAPAFNLRELMKGV
jgi:hypothetical protein